MINLNEDYTRVFAFKYMWYKNATDTHWVNSNVRESLRYRHSSNDPDTFYDQTVKGRYAGLHSFCCSVWSATSADDAFQSNSAFTAYLDWLMSGSNPVPDFKAFILYELTVANAAEALAVLEAHRYQFTKWSYAKHRAFSYVKALLTGDAYNAYVDDAPMFYVYQVDNDSYGYWVQAKVDYELAHPGESVYLMLNTWTGYTELADLGEGLPYVGTLIDAVVKYQPAGGDSPAYIYTEAATTGAQSSITVTPGFHNPPAAQVLAHSISAYRAALTAAVALQNLYGALGLGLACIAIATWDEFVEDSGIAPATGFAQVGPWPGDEYIMATREILGAIVEEIRVANAKEVMGVRGSLTDRSGTITTGGAAQTVAAANPNRTFLFFQNVSDTDMWINFGSTAVADQPSIKLVSGALFVTDKFVPSALLSVYCATTGKSFTCKEG